MQARDAQITTVNGFDGLLFEPIPPETRERLLRFPLGAQDSVLLPLQDMSEILSVDGSDILPIPDMPACVLGICNWRGEMLWLVDFNQFVGYASPWQQEPPLTQMTIIVIQNHQQALGLAIPQVNDIELHDLQQLQPPAIGLFSPGLLPFVRGILPGCSDAVLDLQSLIHAPLWKKHPKGEA